MAEFDTEAVRLAIESQKDHLFTQIRQNLRSKLLDLSPAEALSFLHMSGEVTVRELSPALSKEYAGTLIAFCRGKKYEAFDLDSAVTPVVTAEIERTLIEVFSGEKMGQAIGEAILSELNRCALGAQSVRNELRQQQKMLGNEIAVIAHQTTAHSLAGQVIDIGVQHVQDFMASAMGKQLMFAIGQILSTTAGKVMVAQLVKIVVAKVMASVALQTALLSIVRKVGVGILIKTAIGKALIGLLAVVGLAHVPAVWIILPILGAFLAYEYHAFPEKLADKIPQAAVDIIAEKFLLISDSIARKVVERVLQELAEQATKVKT